MLVGRWSVPWGPLPSWVPMLPPRVTSDLGILCETCSREHILQLL